MPKIPECDRCQRYSKNPHLVCAIHPIGPDSDSCLDFAPNAGAITQEIPEPVGASFYSGALVPNTQRHLSRQEQLELLDTHPLFTGMCPQCGYEMNEQNRSRSEWHCDRCGWNDPS